jgi:hypothetical protein
MTIKDLESHVRKLIADKIDVGEIIKMEPTVQELISRQGEITGEDVSFYLLCAHEYVWQLVKKAVGIYDQPQVDNNQLTLPGYEFMQVGYTVERDGERQLVPVSLLSDDELLARAKEFRKQATSLVNHAEEIEKYVANRNKLKTIPA